MANGCCCPLVTVSDTVVVCVIPPPTPVTVIGYVPSAAPLSTVKVNVELPLPGAAIGLGANPAVTPLGTPVALSVIAELKPPLIVVVIVDVPDDPCATLTALGDAEIVKSGWVTTRVTDVVCVPPPPIAVTVIG